MKKPFFWLPALHPPLPALHLSLAGLLHCRTASPRSHCQCDLTLTRPSNTDRAAPRGYHSIHTTEPTALPHARWVQVFYAQTTKLAQYLAYKKLALEVYASCFSGACVGVGVGVGVV